jgi:hypothetical protein
MILKVGGRARLGNSSVEVLAYRNMLIANPSSRLVIPASSWLV